MWSLMTPDQIVLNAIFSRTREKNHVFLAKNRITRPYVSDVEISLFFNYLSILI